MNKKELKEYQPVVYQTLSNALKRNRLAHAYLFEGDKSSPKKETALLFAQSIVCPHTDADGFACQECDVCKRIEHKESIDVQWVKGGEFERKKQSFGTKKDENKKENPRIKKEDMKSLQKFFESTSAEKENYRIYVLDGFDQATPDAQNSLLKFLEEPQEGIFGILLADEKSNVLATIQSRTQWIHFRPSQKWNMIKELSAEYNIEYIELLADSGYTMEQAREYLSMQEFEIIVDRAAQFLKNKASLMEIFELQTEVFVNKSNMMKKEYVRFFLEVLLHEVRKKDCDLGLEKKVKIQTILVENMDILRRPVDLALFLDKIYTEVRKVVNE